MNNDKTGLVLNYHFDSCRYFDFTNIEPIFMEVASICIPEENGQVFCGVHILVHQSMVHTAVPDCPVLETSQVAMTMMDCCSYTCNI